MSRRNCPLPVEHEPPSRRFLSVAMLLAAMLHVGIAIANLYIEDVPFGWVNSMFFLVAAGGCIRVATNVENLRVVALAGAFTMTAYASRAGMILFSWIVGDTSLDDSRVWLSLFSWLLITLYAFAIFVRGVAPLSRLYLIQKLAREDA